MKYNFPKLKQLNYFLSYAIRSRISDKYRTPLLCGFKLTNNCNLKCSHCPFWRHKNAASLEFSQAKLILDKLSQKGVKIVIFEGGEPLLWNNISRIVEYAKSLFYFVGITTNATIDLSKAEPNIYFISIDGLKGTHDKIRGKSFEKIIDNIEKNKNLKKIIVNICINIMNYSEIGKLIKFLEDKVFGITIQFFYPFPDVKNLCLNSIQRRKVLEKLIKLKKSGHKVLNSYSCLEKMKDNSWKCFDFLVSSIDPDGSINYGCYLKNRTRNISCKDCGYSAHCEISLSYALNIEALKAAKNIFWG